MTIAGTTTYQKCRDCWHFIEENDAEPVPGIQVAAYVHLDNGEKDHDHDAWPSGDIRTLDLWRRDHPELFITYDDGETGPNSAHFEARPEQYYSADNYPVVVGAKFWNNDLRVCEITRLEAIPARPYADTGETSTWHDTTHGMFDTLTGYMRQYGRMARWFEGKNAEDYEPGTSYADIKGR